VSDTPITDAARLKLDSDDSSCSIYAHTLDGSSYHSEVVRGDEMATLERENAAMREAIREAASAFKMLSDVEPKTFAEQLSVMAVCHVEFTKLQPFLKP